MSLSEFLVFLFSKKPQFLKTFSICVHFCRLAPIYFGGWGDKRVALFWNKTCPVPFIVISNFFISVVRLTASWKWLSRPSFSICNIDNRLVTSHIFNDPHVKSTLGHIWKWSNSRIGVNLNHLQFCNIITCKEHFLWDAFYSSFDLCNYSKLSRSDPPCVLILLTSWALFSVQDCWIGIRRGQLQQIESSHL